MNIVGIMSGTSLDGIDYVLCKIKSAQNIEFVDQASAPFPAEIREKLMAAATGELKVAELSELHFSLGKIYAKELAKIKTRKKWKIDLIGLHGQTIYHAPPKATWQLGEPTFLKHEFGKPVIYDFRSGDLTSGGQGAPLAPVFHAYAFAKQAQKNPIAIHNLGGISNITFINKGARTQDVKAFDTGPANMLLDLAMEEISRGEKKVDKNGELAARGVAHVDLVVDWLRHPYFAQKPPKSTGRELFGQSFFIQIWRDLEKAKVQDPANKMATILEFTAQSIFNAYRDFAPKNLQAVYLCGGGSQNATLVKRLKYLLSPISVNITDDIGWPTQAVEGAAFALLAYLRLEEQKINLKTITGSSIAQTLGNIC